MMASRCRKHTGRSKTAGSFLYRLFCVMGVIRTQRTRTHICKIVCRTTFCILTSCTDCQSNQRKENTFWLKATFMGERGKKRNNKPFFCLLSHLHGVPRAPLDFLKKHTYRSHIDRHKNTSNKLSFFFLCNRH